MEATARIAVLVGSRGRGTNMAALAAAGARGAMPAAVALVCAPSPDAPALELARRAGARVAALDLERFPDAFLELARREAIDLVCLAGYLRLVPGEVLRAFPDRVLNIHPALLPKFGGKGMYGRRVHEAVLAAGERESGCTVHLASERYDEGRILLQRRCPVLPDDTPETLAARVLIEEHLAYPEGVGLALGSGGGEGR